MFYSQSVGVEVNLETPVGSSEVTERYYTNLFFETTFLHYRFENTFQVCAE